VAATTVLKKFVREPNTNITLLINIGCAPQHPPRFLPPKPISYLTPSAGQLDLIQLKGQTSLGRSWLGFQAGFLGRLLFFWGGGKWKNAGAVGHMQTSDDVKMPNCWETCNFHG